METGPSLLLALLGVADREKLEDIATHLELPPNPAQADLERITKYESLPPEKKEEVQKKLYETLYVITEYPALPQNRDLSMAIGRILAHALRKDIIPTLQPANPNASPAFNEFSRLRDVLYRGVAETIDKM